MDKIIEEFVSDLESFENQMDSFYVNFNEYANDYRLKTNTKRKGPNTFHNTFVPETTRAVETLTTTIFRMLTANDPNFEPIALSADVTSEHLYASSATLRYQQDHLEFKQKLLSAIRSCVLFGTIIVEEPWTKFPFGSKNTIIKGTDFVPRTLLQIAFDPMCSDIEASDWIASIDWISPQKLKRLVISDSEPSGSDSS